MQLKVLFDKYLVYGRYLDVSMYPLRNLRLRKGAVVPPDIYPMQNGYEIFASKILVK